MLRGIKAYVVTTNLQLEWVITFVLEHPEMRDISDQIAQPSSIGRSIMGAPCVCVGGG